MEHLLFVLLGAGLAALAWVLVQRFWSFKAQSPADYAGQGPALDIREHLKGAILCEGVIYGPTGRVASRFVADMNASWQGDLCTLAEDFRYDSGATQSRCWTLQLSQDGRIAADAPDLEGTGSGQQQGPSLVLRYRIRLPEASGGHVLDVTDWMYLVENGVIINRSQFRKFGIKVAELVATMRPKEADAQQARQEAA